MTRKKITIIIGATVVVILLIVVIFGGKPKTCPRPVYLEIWGAYDEVEVFSEIIKAYEKENKCAKIKYVKKNFDDYEEQLLNAFASDKNPDIFMIHNTWLPKYKDKITPLPEISLPFVSFRSSFVDVVEKDLTRENIIYGLPLYVDTLALYYNKDYFNTAGITYPPETWDELIVNVNELTKRGQSGAIERAGIAMGTAENINRSTDILCLLMLQNGTEMNAADRQTVTFTRSVSKKTELYYPGQDALRFYTDFANPSKDIYTWNRQMSYSVDAFAEGKAAMMINYSHHIETIRSKNPYLNFAVGSMPQLKDREFDVNYANYWAFTVAVNRKDSSDEAWKFIVYLTNKENSQKYLIKTKKPTARRDLVDWQQTDLDFGIFAKQSLSARSWDQIESSKIETILTQAIESVVLGGANVKKALEIAVSQINLLVPKE